MKLTYENQTTGAKVILEDIRDDADIYEMQEILERFLMGMGYQQSTVESIFASYNQEDI